MSALPRYFNFRTLALLIFYLGVTGFSYWAAYELRFDFAVPENHAADRIRSFAWVLGLQLILLWGAGQFDAILAYFRLPDALRLFSALFFSALILLACWYFFAGLNVPPRAVILSNFLLNFLLIASFRVGMRVKSSRGLKDWFTSDTMKNVLIVGAGEVGAGLASDLLHKSRLGMRPVAFLDDDPQKIGRYVHGIQVAGAVDDLPEVAKRYAARKVIVAFPSASVKRVRQVTDLAQAADLGVETVPALTDLVSGRATLTQLRPMQLEDLLGRDAVDLNSAEIRSMLQGKRVLLTGAGGSIGRELASQILEYGPSELHCIDQSEIAIFNLQQEVLQQSTDNARAHTKILDITQGTQLKALFAHIQPEIVFHAAAHKHVALMENQPEEALRNNFLATAQLARIASEAACERFILISTDKAINPTSVMGVSKRLAELAILTEQANPGNHTRFMAVRFGNVLGSSGSVIPIFRRQIANGGPLTVTDPEVTRFFMTVEEAVGLVLQCATQGDGGEIFVLDMGKSVKIIDMARQMIALSGLREGIDIDIAFTGLQPGEKLYEEVQHLSESLQPTKHPRILRFMVEGDALDRSEPAQAELARVIETGDALAIKRAIQTFVPEYTPWGIEGATDR